MVTEALKLAWNNVSQNKISTLTTIFTTTATAKITVVI